jgi:hypothetical protein
MSDASMPIGTDPLGAIRVELVNAARRRAAARRRRQRLTTVAATALMTLVSVAGAGALVAGSTGVPAIDDFLARVDSNSESKSIAGHGQNDSLRPVAPASPSSASQPLEVPGPDGSKSVFVAELTSGGSICLAFSKPHGEGAGEAREGWGCMTPDALSRSLTGEPVLLADARAEGATRITGYAAADVDAIALKGPGGPFVVRLGEAWRSDAAGAVAVRPFVAVGTGQAADVSAVGDLHDYSVEARMEDGRTLEVQP